VRHSWTGGQYSVWRALLAVAVAIPLERAIADWPFRILAALVCLALAVGFRDRIAALGLAVVAASTAPAVWATPLLLLLHATTHGSPYGSFDARGRTDPAGGWILPRWNFAARRLLLLAVAVASVARGRADAPLAVGVALSLAAVDPGWIPPARASRPIRVFYDGSCGLCHRFVRFLLAEDRTGSTFRFAPLQGETFQAAYPADVRKSYPDSIVVEDEEGRVLIRSRAALAALAHLGGLWRALAAVAWIVPAPLRDVVYDGVAVVRHRLFARPSDVCPLVPAHLARRFEH
jgi:predicted DCC family thiol-disulfide oxidoreductase YuxK